MADEIPKDAPLLTVGRRTCALYERSWTDNKGTIRKTITLAEVIPAETVRRGQEVVVVKWRRAFKGLNVSLDTRDDWAAFARDLGGLFARGVGQLKTKGASKTLDETVAPV